MKSKVNEFLKFTHPDFFHGMESISENNNKSV